LKEQCNESWAAQQSILKTDHKVQVSLPSMNEFAIPASLFTLYSLNIASVSIINATVSSPTRRHKLYITATIVAIIITLKDANLRRVREKIMVADNVIKKMVQEECALKEAESKLVESEAEVSGLKNQIVGRCCCRNHLHQQRALC
jgi:hypothetical protein